MEKMCKVQIPLAASCREEGHVGNRGRFFWTKLYSVPHGPKKIYSSKSRCTGHPVHAGWFSLRSQGALINPLSIAGYTCHSHANLECCMSKTSEPPLQITTCNVFSTWSKPEINNNTVLQVSSVFPSFSDKYIQKSGVQNLVSVWVSMGYWQGLC